MKCNYLTFNYTITLSFLVMDNGRYIMHNVTFIHVTLMSKRKVVYVIITSSKVVILTVSFTTQGCFTQFAKLNVRGIDFLSVSSQGRHDGQATQWNPKRTVTHYCKFCEKSRTELHATSTKFSIWGLKLSDNSDIFM